MCRRSEHRGSHQLKLSNADLQWGPVAAFAHLVQSVNVISNGTFPYFFSLSPSFNGAVRQYLASHLFISTTAFQLV